EVLADEGAQRLGIQTLAQSRRAGHVREQDGDRAAGLLGRGSGLETGAAAIAEAGADRVRRPAPRARDRRLGAHRAERYGKGRSTAGCGSLTDQPGAGTLPPCPVASWRSSR